MVKVTPQTIREVRAETGAPIFRTKKVLVKVKGDKIKAIKILRKEGFAKAAKRGERETSQGIIATYIHHNGKVASTVELLSETDFVAKNELFIKLGNELALQVASMNPKNAKELEAQDFIKDPKKKIIDLVKEVMAKTGENIKIGRIHRVEVGK